MISYAFAIAGTLLVAYWLSKASLGQVSLPERIRRDPETRMRRSLGGGRRVR